MNNIRKLRLKKGIQQKELAIEIGVAQATVSDWEHGRKNPSGERLRKLADFFGVNSLVVLGEAPDPSTLFVPDDPKKSGKSETEQILDRLLKQLEAQPRTPEARLVSGVMDRMPQDDRGKAVKLLKVAYSEYFDDNGEKLG